VRDWFPSNSERVSVSIGEASLFSVLERISILNDTPSFFIHGLRHTVEETLERLILRAVRPV